MTREYDQVLEKAVSASDLVCHLESKITQCENERIEALSPAERMFHDGQRLLAMELIGHIKIVMLPVEQPPVKAGRWEFENGIGDFASGGRTVPCSECHTRQFTHLLDHYCPHCGVYMPEIVDVEKRED